MGEVLFKRCVVVGIGLIGGSFALAGKRAGVLGEVVGVARSERTRSLAVALGAADRATDDPVAACAGADLVYLATPVAAIAPIMQSICAQLPEGCAVTDAGSTKASICQAAGRLLPDRVCFIGGHPMAGSEHFGIEAARADLFTDSFYFYVPPTGHEAQLSAFIATVRAIGAIPAAVDPVQHDALVAMTSHFPHVMAAAIARSAGDLTAAQPDRSRFAGKGFADTTRIAAGPSDVWTDILLDNRINLLAALDRLGEELEAYRDALGRADAAAIRQLLEDARQSRERLLGK